MNEEIGHLLDYCGSSRQGCLEAAAGPLGPVCAMGGGGRVSRRGSYFGCGVRGACAWGEEPGEAGARPGQRKPHGTEAVWPWVGVRRRQ